jgi:hypothetical protein
MVPHLYQPYPLSCFGHVHCVSSPARHAIPPPPYCTHVLPLSLPALPPHPCLWFPSLTPSKPCPARLNSLFVSSLRHSPSQASGPPHKTSFHRSIDVGQVSSPPPNPPTMHFLSHVVPFPCQAHLFGVVFARAGTSAQNFSCRPSPLLLCCFSSAPYPPQPSCTTYAPFLLSFSSEIPRGILGRQDT